MTVIPLFFVYDGAPPVSNSLTRVLVSMFTCAAFVVFRSDSARSCGGLRRDFEFLATLCSSTQAFCVHPAHHGRGFRAGREARSRMVVPSIPRWSAPAAAATSLLIWGRLSRLLTALFLASAAGAILATGILPRWIAWLAFAIATLDVALVPTIYSGTNPSRCSQYQRPLGFRPPAACSRCGCYWSASSYWCVCAARRRRQAADFSRLKSC